MHYPDFRLDGRTALVTGASKGIGWDLAKALADAGAAVAVAARDRGALEKLADEIRTDGGQALAVELDVRDVGQMGDVFGNVREHFGSLDVLVNNAGLGANHPAEAVTESDWDEMMDVNLRGLFFACQAAGRIMLAQGSGRIINMSSQAVVVGIREHAV